MIPQKIKALTVINDLFDRYRYELYCVGGCVRDLCMRRTPKDYDLVTNATPEEIIKLCEDNMILYYPTGEKYGTITINLNNVLFEVTTYRTDMEYLDNRHPESVMFSNNLKDDLNRRDFTMNAMAISVKDYVNSKFTYESITKHIIDPHNGLSDLKNKTIKAIGDADKRFKEDGLRIMRAIRFAIKYNFKIDKDTMNAIWKNHEYLDNISKERIQSEFNQMLLYFNKEDYLFNLSKDFQYKYSLMTFVVKKIFPEMKELAQVTHNSVYHLFDVFTHCLLVCSSVENSIDLKLAALFHDIGKMRCKTYDTEKLTNHFYSHANESMNITRDILKRMRYSNEVIDNVLTLIAYHDVKIENNKKSIKRLLIHISENQFYSLLDLKLADRLYHLNVGTVTEEIEHFENIKDVYKEIKRNNETFSIKDLAINGNDIKNLGYEEGPKIGAILTECLKYVINNPESNTKELLIKHIKEIL